MLNEQVPPPVTSPAPESRPARGSIQYRVLTRAKGRCECSGAGCVAWHPPHQRALEVDHIVPKNHGGSDGLSNLQALCFHCNAGKRDGRREARAHRRADDWGR